jgi:hypothetical protein
MGRSGSRGGYSGSANFEFVIERYRNEKTGDLLKEDDLPDIYDQKFEFERVLITLNISGKSYYDPGYTYGPPEICYPPEEETEIELVTDNKGINWFPFISSYEKNMIIEEIKEFITDNNDVEPIDWSLK